MIAVLQRSENVRYPGTEVTGSCELLLWVLGPKLSPPALKTCSPQQDYSGSASKSRGSLRRGKLESRRPQLNVLFHPRPSQWEKHESGPKTLFFCAGGSCLPRSSLASEQARTTRLPCEDLADPSSRKQGLSFPQTDVCLLS